MHGLVHFVRIGVARVMMVHAAVTGHVMQHPLCARATLGGGEMAVTPLCVLAHLKNAQVGLIKHSVKLLHTT